MVLFVKRMVSLVSCLPEKNLTLKSSVVAFEIMPCLSQTDLVMLTKDSSLF